MKNFFYLVAAVVICIAVVKLYEYVEKLNQGGEPTQTAVSAEAWPPLDPKIKEALDKEKNRGAAQFKALIDKYARLRKLKDPWLANYQVDYVIMISVNDPVQAARIVSEIRSRIGTNSPVYPRVMDLKF